MAQDLFDVHDVEQLVTKWLQSFNFDFVQPEQDNPGGRQRVYAGVENLEVSGVNPDGDPTLVEADRTDDADPQEGEESSIVRVPCIVVWCQEAPALLGEFRGNWEPQVEIQISSDSADTTSARHRARVKQVRSKLLVDDLADQLGRFSVGLTGFENGVFHSSAAIFTAQGWVIDGNCWTSYLRFTLRQARIVTVDFYD